MTLLRIGATTLNLDLVAGVRAAPGGRLDVYFQGMHPGPAVLSFQGAEAEALSAFLAERATTLTGSAPSHA